MGRCARTWHGGWSCASQVPDASALGRRVLVLGGTSEIGLAIVRRLQELAPREVVLVGRDLARLEDAAASLRARGCLRVGTLVCDALDTGAHAQIVARACEDLGGGEDDDGSRNRGRSRNRHRSSSRNGNGNRNGQGNGGGRGGSDTDDTGDGGLDLAIVAVGELGEPDALGADPTSVVRAMEVNFVGAGSLLLHVARRMRGRGAGTIVVLSSIAAQRPRRANAAYGASKAGLDALARALDDELHGHGARIVVVRPGFVRTRMTRGLPPAPLATTPAAVAEAVVTGLRRGARTVWAPRSLCWVALLLRALPRPLFRRIAR